MTRAETAALTDAMLHSGKVLDFSSLPAKKVDKHSTGGVGDKTSLVLAPLCCRRGISSSDDQRAGLGHTGGTLDKLESILGFNVNLPRGISPRARNLRLRHDWADGRDCPRRSQALRVCAMSPAPLRALI